MTIQVQSIAPGFTATAVIEDRFEDIRLSDFRGRYVLLFFYPLDFTFICPTEIVAYDRKIEEFEQRDCQVIAVSTDSKYSHLAWKNTPRNKGGIGPIKYPIVADTSHSISRDYGVLLERHGYALRGTFLIDREGIVRHLLVNDTDLGRSVEESLRILDALRFVEQHGEVCPASWQPGEATIVPKPQESQRFFEASVDAATS